MVSEAVIWSIFLLPLGSFVFAALVVAGDAKGQVGFASGKAKEVPEAIKKATDIKIQVTPILIRQL